MNNVNFLPKSYLRRQKRQRRLLRQSGLIAVSLVALGFWFVGLKAENYRLGNLAAQTEASVKQAEAELQQIKTYQREIGSLQAEHELNRQLAQPVSYGQVLAVLGAITPDEVAMTRLSLDSHRPEPAKAEVAGSSKRKAKRASKEVKAEEPDFIEVEIDGLAPDDISVAALISELDSHPLFSSVKIRSSRSIETRGVIARQFYLSAKVDLAREFEWTPATQEVAHVD
jgi:hypothetical protein